MQGIDRNFILAHAAADLFVYSYRAQSEWKSNHGIRSGVCHDVYRKSGARDRSADDG